MLMMLPVQCMYVWSCVAKIVIHDYMDYWIFFVSLKYVISHIILRKYIHTCDITCNVGCPSLYEMQYSNCGWLGGSAEDEQKTYYTHIEYYQYAMCKDAM